MLQFSYLAKRTERISDKTFRMTLHYLQEDETELLIKIISFGPLVKVAEPDSFAALLRERVERQFQYDFA
jgi:predicted DNA-binding transcriptional regulator YafY